MDQGAWSRQGLDELRRSSFIAGIAGIAAKESGAGDAGCRRARARRLGTIGGVTLRRDLLQEERCSLVSSRIPGSGMPPILCANER
jgi:hypothetical protein